MAIIGRAAARQPGRPTTPQPTTVAVRAPAKVNVQLSVGGRRLDGFHELTNVYMAVSRYDVVTASPAERLRLTISGTETAGVPSDETNLAAQAAILLARQSGRQPRVHIHISKHLPVAGGMAGGSADAAGALVACDALWQLQTPLDELLSMAAELGSDVPFSLLGGVALGCGRGEQLTPLKCRGRYHWVFAVAHFGLSTPEVYRAKERQRQAADLPHEAADLSPSQPRRKLLRAMARGSVHKFAAALHNDLQDVAIAMQPQLATTIAEGRSAGALAGLLWHRRNDGLSGIRQAVGAADCAAITSIRNFCLDIRCARTCSRTHCHVIRHPRSSKFQTLRRRPSYT